MDNITLHPDSNQVPNPINGNKGLIIAIVVVLALVAIGVFTFLTSSSTSKFQGLIQKVKVETQNLQK